MAQTDNFLEIRVGHFIREHRKKRRMNQDVFGDAVGINRKTLLKIENGERLPSGREIFGICDFLKITPNDLLSAGGHIDVEPDDRTRSETRQDEIVQFAQLVYSFFRLSPRDKETISDLVNRMARTDLEHSNLYEFIDNYEALGEGIRLHLTGIDGELSKLPDNAFEFIARFTDREISSVTDLIYVVIEGVKHGDFSKLKSNYGKFSEGLGAMDKEGVKAIMESMKNANKPEVVASTDSEADSSAKAG